MLGSVCVVTLNFSFFFFLLHTGEGLKLLKGSGKGMLHKGLSKTADLGKLSLSGGKNNFFKRENDIRTEITYQLIKHQDKVHDSSIPLANPPLASSALLSYRPFNVPSTEASKVSKIVCLSLSPNQQSPLL